MSPFEQVLLDVSHHPWSHLMDEERDGPWAHWAAWKAWMNNNLADEGGDWEESDWLEDHDGTLEPWAELDLFIAHCDEADALAKLEEKP